MVCASSTGRLSNSEGRSLTGKPLATGLVIAAQPLKIQQSSRGARRRTKRVSYGKAGGSRKLLTKTSMARSPPPPIMEDPWEAPGRPRASPATHWAAAVRQIVHQHDLPMAALTQMGAL